MKQTFRNFPLAQTIIMEDGPRWPFLSRKRSAASTDMRLPPAFPTLQCVFPWPPSQLDQKAPAHDGDAPQWAKRLPGFLAPGDTGVSQAARLMESTATSSWFHASSPATHSLPCSFFTVFALYECCLCYKLWWKQLTDFGCCQWMVYKRRLGK